MTYGFGRFDPISYRNHRGAEIFTDIFDVRTGIGNGLLHGRIYDPAELGISEPFPEYVRVDEVLYQFNPNDPPPNVNQPFNPNTRTYSGPRTLQDTPKEIREIDRKEIIGKRGMHGVRHNQEIVGIHGGIYREKNQPPVNPNPVERPVFEQSSILAQQLRRNIVKGERLLDKLNFSTGEIEKGGPKAFIGDPPPNSKGDKNTFFLNPGNRPNTGSSKDLD